MQNDDSSQLMKLIRESTIVTVHYDSITDVVRCYNAVEVAHVDLFTLLGDTDVLPTQELTVFEVEPGFRKAKLQKELLAEGLTLASRKSETGEVKYQ